MRNVKRTGKKNLIFPVFILMLLIMLAGALVQEASASVSEEEALQKELTQLSFFFSKLEPDSNFAFIQPHGHEKQVIIDMMLERFKALAQKNNDTSEHIPGVRIEYKKINPIKYRLKIRQIKKPFPLIFGLNYHHGWKAYLVENSAPKFSKENKYTSKPFRGTSQNNILSDNSLWETWWSRRLVLNPDFNFENENILETKNWILEEGMNGKALEWPSEFHWKVNGYANCWWIEPQLIQDLIDTKENKLYELNDDGSLNIEMVIEFHAQRFLFVGVAVSCIVGIIFIGILLIPWLKMCFFKSASSKR